MLYLNSDFYYTQKYIFFLFPTEIGSKSAKNVCSEMSSCIHRIQLFVKKTELLTIHFNSASLGLQGVVVFAVE